jgi:hypothetical protein
MPNQTERTAAAQSLPLLQPLKSKGMALGIAFGYRFWVGLFCMVFGGGAKQLDSNSFAMSAAD